jgi:hypothetical protein
MVNKMRKRDKVILIGLVFGFALIMGIFLYPGDKPEVDGRGTGIPKEQPSNKDSSTADLKKPATMPSPAHEAGLAPLAQVASPDGDSYLSYPENILKMLDIDMEKIIEERDRFKNTVTHVEWMDRINEVLKNLDPEKKEAMIKNHTTLLYLKDLLNDAYLSGKIDHDTFIKAVTDLMKWHQQTYQTMLTASEYEALYEITPEAANDIIDGVMEAAPRYSFILNQQIPAEEVAEKVQGYKLEEVDSHFKKMIIERDQIGKKIGDGSMTLEQARAALQKSQAAFIERCKNLLTEEEINTIFGSVAALETGGAQAEPPAVLGNSDEIELGFKIENPDTSIDLVKTKIDKNKLEDIKFFYQQRAKEREELISRLDAGEIKEDVVENTSNEMDKAFEENCRGILTDGEYQLIFGNAGNQQ